MNEWDKLDRNFGSAPLAADAPGAWGELDKKFAAGATIKSPPKKVVELPALKRYNVTDDMSAFERAAAGVGKAIVDTGRGIGNLVGLVSDEDVAESRRIDKDLMDTSAGYWGNIGGSVGMALVPGGALKGAAIAAKGVAGTRAVASLPRVKAALQSAAPTMSAAGGSVLAPKTIAGALGVGASMGAIQPAEGWGERGLNAAFGAGGGALIPAGVRAFKTSKAMMEPFTQAGREKIVGRAIQSAAGNDGTKLTAAMRAATMPFSGPMPRGMHAPETMGEIVPGSKPTVGQIAMRTQSPSIAAIERAATQTDPVLMNASKVRADDQNEARRRMLSNMAGKGGAKDAAIDARAVEASTLYQPVRTAQVRGDAALGGLMERPSIQQAWTRALGLAREKGDALTIGHDIPVQTVASGAMDANGNPIMITTAAQFKQYSGKGLHYLKESMDDLTNINHPKGFKGKELDAANATKAELIGWARGNIPEWQAADAAYASASRPINQMDIADELLQKSTSTLDGRFYPQKFASALDDKTAAHATGWKSSTMENTMSPTQLQSLDALKEDLQTQAFAAGAGKAGSDTVQKLAYSNIINQSGVPNWLRNFGGSQLAGNLLGRTGDIAYANANKQLSGLLGESLMDPKTALKMLNMSQGNDELLRRIGRAGSGAGLLAPALIDAGQ